VPLERNTKYPLDDVADAYRIEGVRLPELAAHLCRLPPETGKADDWPQRLRQLPALMLAGVKLADRTEATFLKAVQANPGEGSHWAAWSDWRQERDLEPPGIALLRDAFKRIAKFPQNLQNKLPGEPDVLASCRLLQEMEAKNLRKLRTTQHSLIHVENHLAQMCLDGSRTNDRYFGQWIFFDDLWASAFPDMANALLRFSARWDVLTPD